jgi:hypothetical protein
MSLTLAEKNGLTSPNQITREEILRAKRMTQVMWVRTYIKRAHKYPVSQRKGVLEDMLAFGEVDIELLRYWWWSGNPEAARPSVMEAAEYILREWQEEYCRELGYERVPDITEPEE